MAVNYVYASYLPKGKIERRDWLINFNQNLPQYAAILGVSAATLAELSNRTQWLTYGLSLQASANTFLKSMVQFADEMDSDKTPNLADAPQWSPMEAPANVGQTGVFNWVVTMIDDSILGHAKLTAPMKTALKLDSLEPSGTVGPEIKTLMAEPGGVVEISFSKGAAKQVIIEGLRGDGTWELLKEVVGTHWSDTRPNAVAGVSESRSYRVRFSDGQTGYGDYSSVKSVSTQG